jgi:hypothetical protein
MGASLQVMKDARMLLSGGQGPSPDKAPSTSSITPTTSIKTISEGHANKGVLLLQFEDVESSLQTAGFVFRRNLYCRPGKDPAKYPLAVLGRDYFTTERAFREHLCAYGLDDCDKWTEYTRQTLATWIRYSIARSLDSKTHHPIFPGISGIKAWHLMVKIGFRHRYTNLLSIYRYPGVEGVEGILGKTKFIDEEKNFYARLCRFGLPDACSYDKITEHERIKLEGFLAEKGRDLTL